MKSGMVYLYLWAGCFEGIAHNDFGKRDNRATSICCENNHFLFDVVCLFKHLIQQVHQNDGVTATQKCK